MSTNLQNYSTELKKIVKLFQLIFNFLMSITPTTVAVANDNCHVDYV